ncbi:MAG: MFS transporter [Pseudomonadota bacterium]
MAPVTPSPQPPARASLRFVALMAYLIAGVALAIDLMLASLVDIGAELSPANPERATLVMGSFFLALGVGTFLVGPLLDSLGRRPVILWGVALYIVGAILSWLAPSLTLMLLGRALMGLGAAAPRVGVQAVIRDRFEGRQMAATISLVMMIFTLIPGVAPVLGAWVAEAFGWRAVFFVFVIFGVVGFAWFHLQQPETLRARKPLSLAAWRAQVVEASGHAVFRQAMFIQLFVFASLYGFLTAGPAIFTQTYEIEDLYPYIFCIVSLTGAAAAFANAQLVEKLGMVRLIRTSLVFYSIAVVVGLAGLLAGGGLWAFLLPMFAGFFVLGFVIGNSQALGMQPLGHIAGTASATLVAAATLGAGALTIPIPVFFHTSATAMLVAQLIFTAAALWSAFQLEPD